MEFTTKKIVENLFFMNNKEAKARIKINKFLKDLGWRFFDVEDGKASIFLENNVRLTKTALDKFGKDFEKTTNGFIDFILLDNKGFPFIVLEAKKESINLLFGKEQARKYAKSHLGDIAKDVYENIMK
jgi:type I restriction enzyme, R subunit